MEKIFETGLYLLYVYVQNITTRNPQAYKQFIKAKQSKVINKMNWDDISINTENPETFFSKRHIKHERVYYDLIRQIPTKKLHLKENENNKENKIKMKAGASKSAINDSDIDKLNKKCEKHLQISTKTNSKTNQTKPSSTNQDVVQNKIMLPATRNKAYDYAEIYKKRKESKAIEAQHNVAPPPKFKSKPLPTFYRSTKAVSHTKPKGSTIPITPMVLKRSGNNKKLIENKK